MGFIKKIVPFFMAAVMGCTILTVSEVSFGKDTVQENEELTDTQDNIGKSEESADTSDNVVYDGTDAVKENTPTDEEVDGDNDEEMAPDVYPAKQAVKQNGFVKSGTSWIYYVKGEKAGNGEDIVRGTINGIDGWYYIKNSVAVLDYTGVKHNIHGWWYVENGKVVFSYNGFAKNEYGWWYIEKGNVTFKKNDVIYGTVNGEKAWWNVKGSNVKFNESVEQNQYGWWYIKNGKVDFSYTGVKNNKYGWWYINNGNVKFSYNGFAKNEYGWWYIEKGNVTFKKNDVIYGTVNGEKAWWNVKGSNVKFNESVEQNKYGWWYIKNGKVDFSYNGIASNQHGTWFIKNGKVDFSVTGWRTVGGNKLYFEKGNLKSAGGGLNSSSEPQNIDGKIAYIRSHHNKSFMLEVKENSLAKGSAVHLSSDSSKGNGFRKYRLEKQSDGYYKIVPLHSELAIGVSGEKVVQTLNNNADEVKWRILQNSDSSYTFVNKATGAYLDAGEMKSGTQLTTKKTAANNKFLLENTGYTQYVSNGCYNIFTGGGLDYAFDVVNCKPDNKTALQSWKKNGNAAQLFKIEYKGDGYYIIKTGASIYDSALNVADSKFAAGSSVEQYKTDSGSKAQKWRILTDGNKFLFISAGGRYVINVADSAYSGGKLKLAYYSTANKNNSFRIGKSDGFLVRNGRKYYFNKNGAKPMIGMDVSAWSENIDWEAVKSDGIEFAIIRTAHRGGQIDPYGERNMSECDRLGIPYGIYYYSTSVTEAEADNDVKVMLGTVKKHNPKLGLFVDIEASDVYEKAFGSVYDATARRKITDLTKRMVSKIKAAGYTAGVYANENYMKNVLYMDEMPEIRWVAKYFGNNEKDTNVIDLEGKGYKIWQFTDSGTVKGVPNKGYADLNTVIEKYW